MKDTSLYAKILGLKEPWVVDRVELSLPDKRVDVYVGHVAAASWECPECGRVCPLYDHGGERLWRHLDTMQLQTYLHARPPRIRCETHGVRQVVLPWAERNARFTALFEQLAIDMLLAMPVERAAKVLRISWDEAWGIKRRAVERGLSRKQAEPIAYLGVDEKAFGKGHDYMTIVYNLDKGAVEYVAEGRSKESLDEFFELVSPEQKAGIKALAMDMWEPYKQSVLEHVPDATDKIVYDHFHISQQVSRAVDQVRRQENKQLMARGDTTLKGAKYVVLKRQENLGRTERQRLDAILASSLRTARAWYIQEAMREFWKCPNQQEAHALWRRIYFRATHTKLQPLRALAHTINRHITNILTYFKHWITSAPGEAINATIQAIKQAARGFRNRDHFKIAIYFRCGKLELYPLTH